VNETAMAYGEGLVGRSLNSAARLLPLIRRCVPGSAGANGNNTTPQDSRAQVNCIRAPALRRRIARMTQPDLDNCVYPSGGCHSDMHGSGRRRGAHGARHRCGRGRGAALGVRFHQRGLPIRGCTHGCLPGELPGACATPLLCIAGHLVTPPAPLAGGH
jgi:hypothetical protein